MKKIILILTLLVAAISIYSQSIESTVYLQAKCLTDINIGIDKSYGQLNIGLAYEHFDKLNLDAIYGRFYAKTYREERYTNYLGFDAGICNKDLMFSVFTKQTINLTKKSGFVFYEKWVVNKFGEGFEFRIGYSIYFN